MRITSQSEISSAMNYIESNPNSNQINTLICEEIIRLLLNHSYSDIDINAHEKFIEIKANEPQFDSQEFTQKNDSSEIESEIRHNILTQYSDYIIYKYTQGTNNYHVLYKPEKLPDIADEIYTFYDKDYLNAKNHPLSLIFYLARNHKILAVFTILNKSIKHLSALTLPVFAANIIEAITVYKAFFVAPILINIFASVIAIAVNLT